MPAGSGRGDRDALGALYEQHAPAVHGLAVVLCGPEHGAAVVGSTFLEVWRHPQSTQRGPERFPAILLSVALRHCLERLRRVAGREEKCTAKPPRSADDGHPVLPPSGIAEGLLALPELQRDAIILTYFGRHRYRAVAAMLQEEDRVVARAIRDGLAVLARGAGDADAAAKRPRARQGERPSAGHDS